MKLLFIVCLGIIKLYLIGTFFLIKHGFYGCIVFGILLLLLLLNNNYYYYLIITWRCEIVLKYVKVGIIIIYDGKLTW